MFADIEMRRGRDHRFGADDVVLSLGRITGRSLSETVDSDHDPDRANDLRVFARDWSLGGVRQRHIYRRRGGAQWHRDGV